MSCQRKLGSRRTSRHVGFCGTGTPCNLCSTIKDWSSVTSQVMGVCHLCGREGPASSTPDSTEQYIAALYKTLRAAWQRCNFKEASTTHRRSATVRQHYIVQVLVLALGCSFVQ